MDEAQQRYVKELISIEYLDDTAALLLRSVYSTREGAKAIGDAAYQTVTSTFSKSGAFSSAYTLEKMGESVYGTYTDESLLRRSEAETQLANLQTALTAVQEQLRTAPGHREFQRLLLYQIRHTRRRRRAAHRVFADVFAGHHGSPAASRRSAQKRFGPESSGISVEETDEGQIV